MLILGLIVLALFCILIIHIRKLQISNLIIKVYETDNKNKIIFVCLFSILCIFLIRYQMPMNTPPTITLRDKFFEILAIFVSFIHLLFLWLLHCRFS